MKDLIRFIRHTPENHRSEYSPVGENNPNCKLTKDDVLEMRKLFAEGMTKRELAAKYNMRQQSIHSIVTRQRWKHI